MTTFRPARRPRTARRPARLGGAAAALAAAALVLGACSNSQESAPADATGTTTAAADHTAGHTEGAQIMDDPSSLEGAQFTGTDAQGHALVEGSSLQVAFSDGTVSVHAGCNRLFGPYTVEAGVLRAPHLASTMMACDQPLMEQDTWVSGFLADGPTVALADGTLTLTGAEGGPDAGTVITLTRTP